MAVAVAAACRPGAVTRDAAHAPSLPGAECKTSEPSLHPLVVEGPVTVQFMHGTTPAAEKTTSFPTRCQIAMSECPRTNETSSVVFNDAFEGSDRDPARCARRAAELACWCGAGRGATARFLRGRSVELEERVAAPVTRCQITLPDGPRTPSIAGPFNDAFDRADVDESRCLRRADEWRNHCGTGSPVTARFFRGGVQASERVASTPTRCQMVLHACPAHPEHVGVFQRCLRRLGWHLVSVRKARYRVRRLVRRWASRGAILSWRGARARGARALSAQG